ncbi:Uncharacterized protein Fot_35330 [Forsythia ovata]|uniref:Uncharacterized protein n=1 Tax=Forsythia ovata TaxID=205694 RepID=A0ABD1SL79_9LAMI
MVDVGDVCRDGFAGGFLENNGVNIVDKILIAYSGEIAEVEEISENEEFNCVLEGKLFVPSILARGAIVTRGAGCGAVEDDLSFGSRRSSSRTDYSVLISTSAPYPPKDKRKEIAIDTGEVAGQKSKAFMAVGGFMEYACKTRRVEKSRRASSDLARESNMFALTKLRKLNAKLYIREAFVNDAKLFDLTHSKNRARLSDHEVYTFDARSFDLYAFVK